MRNFINVWEAAEREGHAFTVRMRAGNETSP
jgi:hypothetical protein